MCEVVSNASYHRILWLAEGVSLSLNGVTVANDGYLLANDIGVGDAGLHCNTDRNGCCRTSDGTAQGHWYLPDGTQIESFSTLDTGGPRNFFYRNRFTRVVRLNRIGTPSERGRFRCEVMNDAGDNVTVYVNIGEWQFDQYY